MEMKTQTLVNKLHEKLERKHHVISMGELNLAIRILRKASEQDHHNYVKLKSLIP